ncbi:MAG: hypothetical protein IJ272_00205 [Clostridia bacterium]|nr:hypothetical protein [Clostridia bacterium]
MPELQELQEVIKLRDREIKDIKSSLADVLQLIRDLVQDVNSDNIEVKKRQISELATNTIYDLRRDLLEEKIIELPTTDQSDR